MKMKTFVALSIIVLIIAGCGSDEPSTEISTTITYSQDTPKETLKTFFESFVDGDKEKFKAVAAGDDNIVETISGTVDLAIEMKNFEKDVIDEYGAQAWQEVNQDNTTNSMSPDVEF